MRVLAVVLALVVAPFVAGVSQSQQGSNCDNGLGDEHRSAEGEAHAHQGQCANPTPGCAVTPPLSLGTAEIDGKVYDANAGTGLAGWCVELSGAATATTQSDATGLYSFTGLPDGTYLVCEVPPTGWLETFPDATFGALCPGGYGWSFSLSAGEVAQLVNFGNVTSP